MQKIGSLTLEQEAKFEVYVAEYTGKFLNYMPIEKEKAEAFFQWLYQLSGLQPFQEFHVVKGPMEAQILANKLCGTKNKYYDFSSYGNAWDFGWLSFYKYMQEELGIQLGENFNKYHELVDLHIYDTIQFDQCVIAVELPTSVKRKGNQLHCEDGPALVFGDGLQSFFWNGVKVPENLIMGPITAEDVLKTDNAEIRRCYREKLGGKAYYELITGEDGLLLLDEDTDGQGYPMKLYRTKIADSVIDRPVVFLEVTCPSTDRVYNIYPPDQNVTNVWAAKSSTFSYEKGRYRHGDVMLKQVGQDFERPEVES